MASCKCKKKCVSQAVSYGSWRRSGSGCCHISLSSAIYQQTPSVCYRSKVGFLQKFSHLPSCRVRNLNSWPLKQNRFFLIFINGQNDILVIVICKFPQIVLLFIKHFWNFQRITIGILFLGTFKTSVVVCSRKWDKLWQGL